MKQILVIALIMIFMPINAYADETTVKQPANHKFYEKDYQKYWCSINKGLIEYRLPDKSRVDCVTKNYAIEFDFANKWAESIGQALYYSEQLKKLPGIVLISERGQKDEKFIKRLLVVAETIGIKVWIIKPEDLIETGKL